MTNKGYGLHKGSTLQEIITRHNSTATRYRVVKEQINLETLRRERVGLEDQLDLPEPTVSELIEEGRISHPYYVNRESINERIKEIDRILGK